MNTCLTYYTCLLFKSVSKTSRNIGHVINLEMGPKKKSKIEMVMGANRRLYREPYCTWNREPYNQRGIIHPLETYLTTIHFVFKQFVCFFLQMHQ